MLDTERINELIGVDDSWKAPDHLMNILLDKSKRIELFKSFLKNETDMSYDWFHMYFQDVAAQVVAKQLGHTDTNMLSRVYGHILDEKKRMGDEQIRGLMA